MSFATPPSQAPGRRPVRRRSAFRLVGHVILAVHTTSEPTPEEWEDYIRTVVHAYKVHGDKPDLVRQLLLTDGGGPNPAQRAAVLKATEGIPGVDNVPRAVISSSKVVRGIVTALNWLNRNVKLFSPEEIEKAIAFLGIDEATVDELWDHLMGIDAEIGPIEMIRAAKKAWSETPAGQAAPLSIRFGRR